MPMPPKPQLAIYAAFAVAILLIGARFLRSGGDAGGGAGASGLAAQFAPSGSGTTTSASGADGAAAALGAGGPASASATTGGAGEEAAPDGQLYVDVKGAVHRPGVYRLPAGARALDAVRLAGGLTHRADRLGVNLAARVVDGGEVVVPARGAAATAAAGATGGSSRSSDAAGSGSSGSGSGKATGPLVLDLNTATAEQLEQLDGVGPATAAKIVAYRTQHGGIASVDQLDDVPGIGPAKLAAIRAQLGR